MSTCASLCRPHSPLLYHACGVTTGLLIQHCTIYHIYDISLTINHPTTYRESACGIIIILDSSSYEIKINLNNLEGKVGMYGKENSWERRCVHPRPYLYTVIDGNDSDRDL